MGLEAQAAAVGVDGVDHANADTGIQLIYQFTDDPSAALRTGLGCGMQEDLQSGTVIVVLLQACGAPSQFPYL